MSDKPGKNHPEHVVTFEYEVWQLLAKYRLPPRLQTILGKEIVDLANKFIGVDPSSTPRRRKALSRVVHFFPGNDDLSRCGRLCIDDLDPSKATRNPFDATCLHCKKYIASDISPSHYLPNHTWRNENSRCEVCDTYCRADRRCACCRQNSDTNLTEAKASVTLG